MECAISMLGFWKKQHMKYTLSRKDFHEMCQSEGSNIVDKNCNLKIYFSPFIILGNTGSSFTVSMNTDHQKHI